MNPSQMHHHPAMDMPEGQANKSNGKPKMHQFEEVMEDSDEDLEKPAKRSGRRKIKIEYIEDKNRRHITFSKRKAGIMKKAYELSTLTGTQVLLLVVSETGLVYTFTTVKLQPIVTKPEGKNLIQACLNAPDAGAEKAEESDAGYGRSSPNANDNEAYEEKPEQTHQGRQGPPQQQPSSQGPPTGGHGYPQGYPQAPQMPMSSNGYPHPGYQYPQSYPQGAPFYGNAAQPAQHYMQQQQGAPGNYWPGGVDQQGQEDDKDRSKRK
ncbi:hypothetical protein INT43_006247 [Umbelopsis isabellina]|uniref:MADS-box domain-containing protein n=1 Tax=Mortierella isabellina TaxID=91625 RepID=A0A8H7PZR4_MORIS|nr:hypothetical protein INT43_006247 [Umbelopsis isabellina]